MAFPAFGLAIVSALLVRICYQPIHLSPVAFVALVPLFWGLRRLKPAMAFWVGLLFATILGLFGVHWFVVVDRFNSMVWFGILPLAVYIGFYFAVALSLIVFFARRYPPWPALGIAMICWAGIEYWFSIGPLGMPYGLAQSQAGWLSMAQVASIGGMPLLSALILGFNLVVMEVIAAFRAGYGQAGALSRFGVFLALLICGWIYGAGVIRATEEAYADPGMTVSVRMALLQPNISQDVKYASYATEDSAKRRELQDQLTMIQLDQLRGIERGGYDLIVTPESTFTADFMDIEEIVQQHIYGGAIMKEVAGISRDLDIPIIISGDDNVFATIDGEPTELFLEGADSNWEFYPGHVVYGGLWLIRPTDEGIRHAADYRKRQLMPFGEAVPYLDIIPGFQEKIVQVGTFGRGEPGEPIGFFARQEDATDGEIRIGPSICFEDQFPYIHRHFARRGANIFVNVTNDGWFDGSSGPAWHAEMARWRSIETRLPMVRCTNTGLTIIYGPTGEVVDKLPMLEQGILSVEMRVLRDPPRTLFTRFGNWFGLLSLLGLVALVVGTIRPARRR